MTPQSRADLPVIGWREWIALPDLGIRYLKVKVDTGARTSALHAFDISVRRKGSVEWVSFTIHPEQRRSKPAVTVELPVLEWRRVRSSVGEQQSRPVVTTTVELLGQRFPVELTLTNRDEMGFRMLLGRQAIRRRFLVDAGGSFRGGRRRVPKRRSSNGEERGRK